MYLVVEKDDKVLAIHHEYSTPKKYNSAVLIPSMLKIFQENNLDPKDVNLIAVNSGPGSFTGIRAGGVVARTLGQFLNAHVVGIQSLEIYANAYQTNKDKYIILDARRSKWYIAHYSSDNKCITEPSLEHDTVVLDFIKDKDLQIITEPLLKETLSEFNPVLFEDIEEDFGLVITKLAKQKLKNTKDPEDKYAWYNFTPTYLQTPSITMPKKSPLAK